MATATQLMPSPTGGLKSAFSPYTESPSSPGTFAHLFSNRYVPRQEPFQPPLKSFSATMPRRVVPAALILHKRSSGTTSDHLIPPPSPYPATVDPSPVDSNGTNATEVHSSCPPFFRKRISEADSLARSKMTNRSMGSEKT